MRLPLHYESNNQYFIKKTLKQNKKKEEGFVYIFSF